MSLSVPTFPSVPQMPGVPAVLRDPLATVVTLASPIISGILGAFIQTWGVFDKNGKQILFPDTFLGIEYRNVYHVATHPVEQGSFAAYNKVKEPFHALVRMAVGGTVSDRESFLQGLETLVKSTELYNLVTPEETYFFVNLERFDYRRETRNGAGMIIASCHFMEIRQRGQNANKDLSCVPDSAITNDTTSLGMPDSTAVSSPSAAAQVNLGPVRPQTPSTSTTGLTTSALAGIGL